MKKAIILYGPPGSGKGTQANLLAERFDMIHFDTGKVLEAVVYDPKRQKEAPIRRERKNFETGKLMTPSFVAREVVREIKRVAAADWGLVFSGSPRTMHEAEIEYPILEKLYGKKNIYVFQFIVPPASSIERNSHRLICTVCKEIILSGYHPLKIPKHCPVCAGPLYRRTLDKPDVIKVRIREYDERTFPILAFLRKRGYRVIRVDARPAPFKVFGRILRHIK